MSWMKVMVLCASFHYLQLIHIATPIPFFVYQSHNTVLIQLNFLQIMGRSGGRDRRRRRSDESESESPSDSDSDRRHRSGSRRKQRDSDSDRRKKKSSRNITEEEIAQYMAKKAQTKVIIQFPYTYLVSSPLEFAYRMIFHCFRL